MPINEARAINARDLANNPDEIYTFQRAYIMITETSLTNRFEPFLEAMQIVAEAGWEVISVDMQSSYAAAFCRNPNFKRKNRVVSDKDI